MPTAPPSSDVAVEARVFWLRFQKGIAAALVIVILAIVGFAGYRFYTSRRNSTAAGASAYLLLAETQRDEKKFAQANSTLQMFVDKNPEHDFVPTARLAMAANLESMGKNDEALSIYQDVAAKYANTYTGPLALISQVTLLKAKNRIDDE